MSASSQRYLTRKNKDGKVVLRVDKKTKKGEYFFVSNAKQNDFINKIELVGFDHIPSGFYTSGKGLTSAGYHLAEMLYTKFEKRLNIIIQNSGDTEIRRRGRGIFLYINHDDLRVLNRFFKNTRAQGTESIRNNVLDFLSRKCPEHFQAGEETAGDEYEGGEVAQVLNKKGLLENLSDHDRKLLHSFIPKYVESVPFSLRSDKKFKIITDVVDAQLFPLGGFR